MARRYPRPIRSRLSCRTQSLAAGRLQAHARAAHLDADTGGRGEDPAQTEAAVRPTCRGRMTDRHELAWGRSAGSPNICLYWLFGSFGRLHADRPVMARARGLAVCVPCPARTSARNGSCYRYGRSPFRPSGATRQTGDPGDLGGIVFLLVQLFEPPGSKVPRVWSADRRRRMSIGVCGPPGKARPSSAGQVNWRASRWVSSPRLVTALSLRQFAADPVQRPSVVERLDFTRPRSPRSRKAPRACSRAWAAAG